MIKYILNSSYFHVEINKIFKNVKSMVDLGYESLT